MALTFKSLIPMLLLTLSLTGMQYSHRQRLNPISEHESIEKWEGRSAYEQQLLELQNSVPNFGYRNLIADWSFLRFIQYFGASSVRKETGYSLSTAYFENIIENDPYFIESYVFLINTVSMYAGLPQVSIELIEKGLANMAPDSPNRSYFLWRHKGTDELLFLGDTQSAQDSYQTAADWARQSSDSEAPMVAKLSQKTANFLATDPSSRSAQISAWSNVLIRATDENIRQTAKARIENLGGRILQAKDGQVSVRYKTGDE